MPAVETNIRHGLPLSIEDREAAASRIVADHPQWSDRVIAEATGLSAMTVAAVRARVLRDTEQPQARIGRDGKVRPLSTAKGRRMASEMITAQPELSLRTVAKAAGISPATVRDVRERIHRGDDPIPQRQHVMEKKTSMARKGRTVGPPAARRSGQARDRTEIIGSLRSDPSLRYSESGRAFLCWLDSWVTAVDGWEELIKAVPPHCTYVVAELVNRCADEWQEFARQLRHVARCES